MTTLVRTENEDMQQHFDFAALMIVLFTAEMKGWSHSGGDYGEPFDNETSEDLCETLEGAVSELEEDISSTPEDYENMCNDCFFNLLQKQHQAELIREFLQFCQRQPFHVNFEN